MKTLIALVFISLSTIAVADDGKPHELPDFSGLKNQPSDSKAVNYSVTCRLPDGRQLESDHPEYNSCLQKAQSSHTKSPETGTTLNFNLGD